MPVLVHGSTHMLSESLLVVIATTLSGGLKPQASTTVPSNESCPTTTASASWGECVVLNSAITPQHLLVPWVICLGTIVVLSMPTVLLRSKTKEKGLRTFACNLLMWLGLLSCLALFTDHPSICFTLSLHSCVRLLAQMEVSNGMIGSPLWWSLRYLVILGLLGLEVAVGPAISVVRWPSTPSGTALPCAYLAHLAGCIFPDLVLVYLRWLIAAARYVHIHDN